MLSKFKQYLNQKTPILFPIIIVLFYLLYRLVSLYSMDWDIIGYHHIAKQLLNGNFNAIFNETWSPLQPVLLVGISKITGLNFFISQFIIEMLVITCLILVSKKLVLHFKLYQFLLTALLLLLPMNKPDQLFGLILLVFLYYLLILINGKVNGRVAISIVRLTLLGILMLFAKGVGSIIFIGTIVISIGLILIFKVQYGSIRNHIKILTISLFSFFIIKNLWVQLKENCLKREASWSLVGDYNLSIINTDRIAFNKVDHWENVCVYGFTPDLKNLSKKKMDGDGRSVHQLSWLDIAWHNRKENKTFAQTYLSFPKYILYAIANFWIMTKEFFPLLILLVGLFYLNIVNRNIGNLILLVPIILQVGIVVLVHIEDRFLNILFFLLLIISFRTISDLRDSRLKMLLNTLNLTAFFPSFFMFVSNTGILNSIAAGGIRFDLKEPTFITQKIPAGNYLLENNISTAYSVVHNPNVFFYKPGEDFSDNNLDKIKLIDNKYVVEKAK